MKKRTSIRNRKARQRLWLWAGLLLAVIIYSASFGQTRQTEHGYKVTFVSPELIYLNGGRADGLTIGIQGRIVRHGEAVGDVELLHLAEHSAAGRIKNAVIDAQVGDSALFAIAPVAPASPAAPNDSSSQTGTQPKASATATKAPKAALSTPPRVTGSLWTQGGMWDDQSASNLDNSQMRGSLDLRVDGLLAPDASFQWRSTGRQDKRDVGGGADPYSDWSSQITELSIAYAPVDRPVAFAMGRIMPAQIFISQRIDGLEVDTRLSGRVRAGMFGGANSRWQYDELRSSLQTYGVFAGYRNARSHDVALDFTLAAIGEYHGKISSREALLTQGRVSHSSRWSVSHTAEIDINRGWRRDESGGSLLSISSAYASGQYRFSPWLSAGLSYDTRQNYRTYETRDIIDSIFDDRIRQGVRGQVDMMFRNGFSASAGMGYRHRAGDPDATISYTAALRQNGVLTSRTSLALNGSQFSGGGSNGQNLSIILGQSMRHRDWVSVGYGLYSYSIANDLGSHVNNRWTISSRFEVVHSLYLSTSFELDHGDDREGRRWDLGVGRIF